MDRAFIQDAQHDVDRQDRGQDQQRGGRHGLLELLGCAAEIAMDGGGEMQIGLGRGDGLRGLVQADAGGRLKLTVAEGSPSVWLTEALVLAEAQCATEASGSILAAVVLIALPLAALEPSEALGLLM
jgi:hypothetical protein